MGSTAAIGQVLGMVQMFLLARWLGPEKYAIHVANFSLCTLTSFVVNWGLDTWLLRTLSQPDKPKSQEGAVLVIKTFFGLVWGILLMLIAPKLKPAVYLPSILGLAVIGIFIESLTNTLYVVFFTTNRFGKSSIILICARFLRLLTTILLIFLKNDNLVNFVLLRVIVDLVILLVSLLIIKPDIRNKKVEQLKNIFHKAMPYSGSDLLTLVYNQSDVNLISFMSNDLQTISYYSMAISVVNVIFTVIQALQNVVIPVLTRWYLQGEKKIKQGSMITVIGFGLIGVFLYFIIILFGQDIVNLTLGSSYTTTGMYLGKIAPILIFRSLIIGLTAIIISVNQNKRRLIPQTISVVIKVVVSIAIFPVWRVNGLSWVYVFTEIVLLIGYIWIVIWWLKNEKTDQTQIPHRIE